MRKSVGQKTVEILGKSIIHGLRKFEAYGLRNGCLQAQNEILRAQDRTLRAQNDILRAQIFFDI